MHPLTPSVQAYLATAPPERARALRAWFSAFPTELQDVMLERARRKPATHAAVFGETTHDLGRVVA